MLYSPIQNSRLYMEKTAPPWLGQLTGVDTEERVWMKQPGQQACSVFLESVKSWPGKCFRDI